VRRLLASLVLAAAVAAPALAAATPAFAAAQPSGPVVDVVEIAGLVDRHIGEYALERLDAAERAHSALLVFEMNSLGGTKISDGASLPALVTRIRDARVPVAVFVGPRVARAAGLATFMAAAADVVGVGPSARFGPVAPLDIAHPPDDWTAQLDEFTALARANGRNPHTDRTKVYGANATVTNGFADLVTPSVADLLQRIDGREVRTAAGPVRLSFPRTETTVRFSQPGPIRRLLHAFANSSLTYLCLLAGAALVVFELFQPGFGVAGVTGGLLLFAAGFGLSELPATREGLVAVGISLALLAWDVARDEITLPTFAGTLGLFAGSEIVFNHRSEAVRLSQWLIGFTVAAALIFFVPVMTMVRRATRKPIATEVRARLIGEGGMVRSVLNPEGFVMVGGELWRARAEDGRKHRVGERIVVASVNGAVLLVRGAEVGNGSEPAPVSLN
jgi:membrane-bound serine protease (ClpP class)